jgi:hypothetical protein
MNACQDKTMFVSMFVLQIAIAKNFGEEGREPKIKSELRKLLLRGKEQTKPIAVAPTGELLGSRTIRHNG